jgi:hypothetical protein
MHKKVLYKYFIIIHFVGGIYLVSHPQKNDYVWLLGGSSVNAPALGYQWGTMVADFNEDVIRFKYDSLMTMDFRGSNISFSDNAGNVLMYSNGMGVQGNNHKLVSESNTFVCTNFWEQSRYISSILLEKIRYCSRAKW